MPTNTEQRARIGRPPKGEVRSVTVPCAHCGNPVKRKLSQVHSFVSCSPECRAAYRTASYAKRLADKTVALENGCMVWTGNRIGNGYGHISIGGKAVKTHRLAYEMAHGPIPAGMLVCHRCDNPSCVNADHLFLGTPRDNIRDMHQKGRNADRKGERHPLRKLTAEDVAAIRAARAAGEPQATVAARFGISSSQVYRVEHKINWSHQS